MFGFIERPIWDHPNHCRLSTMDGFENENEAKRDAEAAPLESASNSEEKAAELQMSMLEADSEVQPYLPEYVSEAEGGSKEIAQQYMLAFKRILSKQQKPLAKYNAQSEDRRAKRLQEFNKGRKSLPTLQSGDWVFYHPHTKNSAQTKAAKLSALYRGPFEVVKQTGNTVFMRKIEGEFSEYYPRILAGNYPENIMPVARVRVKKMEKEVLSLSIIKNRTITRILPHSKVIKIEENYFTFEWKAPDYIFGPPPFFDKHGNIVSVNSVTFDWYYFERGN